LDIAQYHFVKMILSTQCSKEKVTKEVSDNSIKADLH